MGPMPAETVAVGMVPDELKHEPRSKAQTDRFSTAVPGTQSRWWIQPKSKKKWELCRFRQVQVSESVNCPTYIVRPLIAFSVSTACCRTRSEISGSSRS